MQVQIHADAEALGIAAAADAATTLRAALSSKGAAAMVVATGASQFATLSNLVRATEIDWSRISCFHLDEYVGLSQTHPASFRKYLRDRFVSQLPTSPALFEYIDGEGNCKAECDRLGKSLSGYSIDLALIGIGENGHLAFNDPPADFETIAPYLVVELDEACRRQQLGEGWFESLESVPRRAISMSIRQLLKSKRIICSVPDERKAAAVAGAIEGPVTPSCPASILQNHPQTTIYLDRAAASLLRHTSSEL